MEHMQRFKNESKEDFLKIFEVKFNEKSNEKFLRKP